MAADRSVLVRLRADVSDYQRKMAMAEATTGRVGNSIDRTSGRLRLFADAAATIGPAFVPIGAVVVPAVAGLAAQLGAAALAGGTMIAAFQGVGDALTAVNEAALEPSTENLQAAALAMQKLSPQARELVSTVQQMRPAFAGVRDAAAAGLFPGLVDGLDELEQVLPVVEGVLFRIGRATGELGEDLGEALNGPRGREFLAFLESEVPRALTQLGHTVGNLTAGLAELWMAFTPLNRDVSGWLLDAARDFDTWASGLSETQGFQDFMAYLRESGPQVAETMGALGNAVLQIVQAAAPLGGPVLAALEAVADTIAVIADSDAGPVIMATLTALTLLSRSQKIFGSVAQSSWGQAMSGAKGYQAQVAMTRRTAVRGAAAVAGVGIAASGAADGIGLTNTASLALTGMLVGPWGAAVGGAIGLMLDLGASNEVSAEDVAAFTDTLNQQTGALTKQSEAWAATRLQQSGVLDQARDLGIDLETVTQAVLGNKDAIAAVNAETQRLYSDPEQVGAVKDFREDMNQVATVVHRGREAFVLVQRATGDAADGFRDAESAAEAFRRGVERLNRILEGRATVRDYEQSLDDFTKSVKENGQTLDITTQKGRDNQAALDGIVASAVAVSETMSRSNRIEFLKKARADFVDTTAKLLGSRDAAVRLWERLVQLDRTKVNPVVEVNTARAEGNVRNLLNAMANIRNIKRTVTVTTVFTGNDGRHFKDTPGGADGELYVGGQRHPYGDKVLRAVAPSEAIISNRRGQADRYRPALRAINDGAPAHVVAARIGLAQGSGGGVATELRVKGTLDTPWGPAHVQGIATAAARTAVGEYDDHRTARRRTTYRGARDD